MYYAVRLAHQIQIHPGSFGSDFQKALISQLRREVEGMCKGDFGYVVMIMEMPVGDQLPMVHSGTAMASLELNFRALIYRAFVGEVVDAVVTSVSKILGVMGRIGPGIQCYVNKANLPPSFEMIQDDNSLVYEGTDGMRFGVGSKIRVRILTSRVELVRSFYTATMADEGLGPIAG